MDKDQLLNLVEREVSQQPLLIGDLLILIGNNWNNAITEQRELRDSKHLHFLSEMLDNVWSMSLYKKPNARLFSNFECCTILDACDAVMPKAIGGSDSKKRLLRHLAESCRALGWRPDDNFIKDIRGKQEWLQNLYNNHPEDLPK